MNQVLIIGRIIRDPAYSKSAAGVVYVRATIAVNSSFGGSDGERDTNFVPIVAFKGSADFINNYLKKGDLVSVEGSFISSTYSNSKNEVITTYSVRVNRIQPLESRSIRDKRNSNAKNNFQNPSSSEKKTYQEQHQQSVSSQEQNQPTFVGDNDNDTKDAIEWDWEQ